VTAHTGSPTDAVAFEDAESLLATEEVGASSAAAGTFEAIYQAHYKALYRYALLTTRRAADAEDLVADTFARALGAWTGGHGPTGRPLPWLLVICRRIATDRWRRRRLIGWVPLFIDRPDHGDVVDLEPGTSDDAIEVREFWIWLDSLTRTIPRRQRELLFLRYERDLTDDEIGEILGLTASGVRSLSTRSIESLRRHPELLK